MIQGLSIIEIQFFHYISCSCQSTGKDIKSHSVTGSRFANVVMLEITVIFFLAANKVTLNLKYKYVEKRYFCSLNSSRFDFTKYAVQSFFTLPNIFKDGWSDRNNPTLQYEGRRPENDYFMYK